MPLFYTKVLLYVIFSHIYQTLDIYHSIILQDYIAYAVIISQIKNPQNKSEGFYNSLIHCTGPITSWLTAPCQYSVFICGNKLTSFKRILIAVNFYNMSSLFKFFSNILNFQYKLHSKLHKWSSGLLFNVSAMYWTLISLLSIIHAEGFKNLLLNYA